jgi:tetratricopeptide (TPR) repeat protein
MSREHASPIHTARALFGLGDVLEHQGDYDQAAAYLREGVPLGREAALADTARALLTLARVEDIRADTAQAALHREEALEVSRRMGDPWSLAFVLNDLGAHARRAGELGRAEALLAESQTLWGETGTRMGQRAALMNLVMVLLERGALIRSISLAREMLELCRGIGDTSPTTARCVEIAAQVLNTVGSVDAGVLLISTATLHRHGSGAPVPPAESAELQNLLESARRALSAESFEKACNDGAGLSIQAAVALAADYLAAAEVAAR